VSPLSANALRDLSLANPSGVELAFGHLRRYFGADRWLGISNTYRTDTVKRINRDWPGGTLNQKHLAEYIAASVPLHVVDGWSYLGRALQAHLIGDVSAARHLGYYAELRAAMSLLAAQGIGVLNRQHFVVTSRTQVAHVRTTKGTHLFTWEALQWWAGTTASASFIGDAIQPYQQGLTTWLSAVPKYAAWQPVAQDWILKLGLDLRRVAEDQVSRNIASYQPSRVVAPESVDARSSAEFAIALWLSLEPTPIGFSRIDLHFLRRTFEEAFQAVEGKRPEQIPTTYTNAVDQLLNGNNVEETRRALVSDYLHRKSEPTDFVLARNASVASDPTEANHHLHVISRATLLLVLASAAARRLIRSSNCDFTNVAFWWRVLGVDRGLWPLAPAVSDPLLDFWEDVRIGLDDLQTWLDRGSDNVASLVTNCPSSFARLSQLELVALWGLAA
jgi:hypothetical protein